MLLFNEEINQKDLKKVYFNTSNVTIQRGLPGIIQEKFTNFNTSNVTIQHRRRGNKRRAGEISIHLMLLFNSDWRIEELKHIIFQYI